MSGDRPVTPDKATVAIAPSRADRAAGRCAPSDPAAPSVRACLRPAGRLLLRRGADGPVTLRRGVPCVTRSELPQHRAPSRERVPTRWVEPFAVVYSVPAGAL